MPRAGAGGRREREVMVKTGLPEWMVIYLICMTGCGLMITEIVLTMVFIFGGMQAVIHMELLLMKALRQTIRIIQCQIIYILIR